MGSQGSKGHQNPKNLDKIISARCNIARWCHFVQMKDHLSVLPQLTQTWVQRSSMVISGTCKIRVKWTKSAISPLLEDYDQAHHSSSDRTFDGQYKSMVVMTLQGQKFMGPKGQIFTMVQWESNLIWRILTGVQNMLKILLRSFKVTNGSKWLLLLRIR